MEDILNVGISNTKQRTLEITSIAKKSVKVPHKKNRTEKIVLTTREPGTNREFKISDAWIKRTDGELRISGLWFTMLDGGISENSALAKVLEFYEADVLGDLLNMKIKASPDENNFLVLVACDM